MTENEKLALKELKRLKKGMDFAAHSYDLLPRDQIPYFLQRILNGDSISDARKEAWKRKREIQDDLMDLMG